MNYVGADLHKTTITLCVMDQNRKVLGRKTLYCVEPHPEPAGRTFGDAPGRPQPEAVREASCPASAIWRRRNSLCGQA
jgi:hypothetical protein